MCRHTWNSISRRCLRTGCLHPCLLAIDGNLKHTESIVIFHKTTARLCQRNTALFTGEEIAVILMLCTLQGIPVFQTGLYTHGNLLQNSRCDTAYNAVFFSFAQQIKQFLLQLLIQFMKHFIIMKNTKDSLFASLCSALFYHAPHKAEKALNSLCILSLKYSGNLLVLRIFHEQRLIEIKQIEYVLRLHKTALNQRFHKHAFPAPHHAAHSEVASVPHGHGKGNLLLMGKIIQQTKGQCSFPSRKLLLLQIRL